MDYNNSCIAKNRENPPCFIFIKMDFYGSEIPLCTFGEKASLHKKNQQTLIKHLHNFYLEMFHINLISLL